MARPLRLEFPGAVYHLTSRGNAKEDICRDDADRAVFLQIMGSTMLRFGWLLYAYCLMGNHYHLLAETPAPNLSRGMRNLNGLYTQRFNRRHVRVGHLFQGRFKAILVEREKLLARAGALYRSKSGASGFRVVPGGLALVIIQSQRGLRTSATLAVHRANPRTFWRGPR